MIFLLVHGETGSGTPGRNIKNRQLQWASTLPLGGPPEPIGSRPCQRRHTLAINSDGGKRNLGLPAGSRPKLRSAGQWRGQTKTVRHDFAAVQRTVSRSPPANQTRQCADGQDTDHVSERRTSAATFPAFRHAENADEQPTCISLQKPILLHGSSDGSSFSRRSIVPSSGAVSRQGERACPSVTRGCCVYSIRSGTNDHNEQKKRPNPGLPTR